MNDTLELQLNGSIPVGLFGTTVERFSALLNALTLEVAGLDASASKPEEIILWNIADLQHEETTIVRARGDADSLETVDRAVRAYDAVGEALRLTDPIPFSEPVQKSAYKLTAVLNGHITSLALSTDANKHLIAAPATKAQAERPNLWQVSWGTLRGEVGAITKRPNLQFTLYDSYFDRAVACFLSREDEALARSVWGKQVEVTGQIYRRIKDDRPVRVRNIVDVQPLSPSGDFRRARGVVPWQPGDELPEVTIRRLRDEWSD